MTTSSISIADPTNLYFFYGPEYAEISKYHYTELNQIMANPNFNLNATTTIFVHGYLENISDPTSDIWPIVDAYKSRNQYNLIVYDYSALAFGDYFTEAAPNAVAVSSMEKHIDNIIDW